MIWGKTNNERNAERLAHENYIQRWHEIFPLKPRVLMNGRTAWLETIWARAEWREPTAHEPAGNPVRNTQPYNRKEQYPVFCVFCQEKGSEYPVCLQCRKAVLAFRSIADAS